MMMARPRIFLSSVFDEPSGTPLPIREKIKALTGGAHVPAGERPIWVAEDFDELNRASTLSRLAKAQFCVEGVRACDGFLAILTERFGSKIEVDGVGQVPTSYLELELMEAALLSKPSFIFLQSDFTPSKELANLLNLLRPAFPDMVLERLSEVRILERVKRIVERVENPFLRWRPLRMPSKRLFIDTLFRLRHRPYRVKDEPPPIRFLDGGFDATVTDVGVDMVEPLLDQASREPNYQNRLTILWLAIRSLMGVPYTNPAFRKFVPLWEDALGAWNSAAAWYGLHGHAAMAGLAALGSLAEARSCIAPASDPIHGIPHGPIASAYYSIAKQVGRSDIYRLALEHIEAVLASGPSSAVNLLAIRGSIQLRLGFTNAAIADYEEVARSREPLGDGAYGEALSELGHALVIAGRKREGLAKLERGVELLQKYPRAGFDVRSMRKLALGYARNLSFSKALDYAVLAYNTAVASGALDQISRLERLAKKIDGLGPRFGRRR
jgi:hypothetical protein